MNYRSLHFQTKKAILLRSNYMIDVTTIRDRILTDFSVVKRGIPIFIEATGGNVVRNPMVGMMMVDVYTGYVAGGIIILTGDVLLVGSTYYEVGSVDNFSQNGWEQRCILTIKNLQRS